MSSFEIQCQEDARLAILAELARQNDGTLNSASITRVVDALGMRRSREWVETQLSWLDGMGAVNARPLDVPGLGKVTVAALTRTGRDHVERRTFISGISRPADEE